MTRTAFARHPLRVVNTDAYASVDAPSTDEEFFTRFAPYVARVGLRLLGREPEVDDLIQDVFVMARELAPTGSLAEDALAREVGAWSTAGRADEASRSARRYQEQYPGGRWLRMVQQHAQTQPR